MIPVGLDALSVCPSLDPAVWRIAHSPGWSCGVPEVGFRGVCLPEVSYDSFGNVTASTGTLFNPFQYAGRESERETGIYYNRARYYDQSSGRFVSEDPIGFGDGENFFRYANDNPMKWSDPLGLSAHDVATLMKLYRNTVDRMNRNGERFPGKGPGVGGGTIFVGLDTYGERNTSRVMSKLTRSKVIWPEESTMRTGHSRSDRLMVLCDGH